MTILYSQQAHDIALTYLTDITPALSEPELAKHAHSLAQNIQGTIEAYINDEIEWPREQSKREGSDYREDYPNA